MRVLRDWLLLILLIVGLIWIFTFALPEQPLQGKGNCGDWDHKTGSAPFKWDAPSGYIIDKVIIKAGTNCFVFKSNGSDGCYKVNGIGTGSAKASRVGEPSPECKEISHVEFYIDEKEEPPTDTPIPPPTTAAPPTETETTEPTPTETLPLPTDTPPVGTDTPTLPPGVTPTVTPTGEESPPPATETTVPPEVTDTPKEKEKVSPTPVIVALPQTGFFEANGGNAIADTLIFPITFVAIVAVIVVIRLIIRKGG